MKLETVFDDHINIPDYQREYSWGSQEADDFFSDLKRFRDSGEDEYLFGQFIFYKEGGGKEIDVIDGQQRLVTTVIFVSVARNIVSKLNIDRDTEEYSEFKNWVYKVIGSEKKEDYKLTLSGKARGYFVKNIQRSGGPENSGLYRAMKNIFAVYNLFKNKLETITENLDDEEKFCQIYGLLECLLQRFYLSTITTGDLSQAYVIFETLNSRGKDLEASDLLKNYLFHLGGEAVKDEWNEATATIADEGESITQFIRVYWNSYNELVRQRQIYRTISRGIPTKKEAIEFVEGMNKTSKFYLSIIKPSSFNEFNDKKIRDILSNLKILGTKLFYPMIMACVKVKTDNKQIYELLKAIESLTIRNIIIGPDTANQFEERFCLFAKRISRDKVDISIIISEVRALISPDEAFKHYFELATIKETSVSRYILATIYNYENGSENIINPNSSEVNLEHIMPRNRSLWTEISEVDHETYLYYIGNQTLLKSDDNTRGSNDPYIDKKGIYLTSKISQNNEYFKDIDEWGPKEIEKRQEFLYKTAVKCWTK